VCVCVNGGYMERNEIRKGKMKFLLLSKHHIMKA